MKLNVYFCWAVIFIFLGCSKHFDSDNDKNVFNKSSNVSKKQNSNQIQTKLPVSYKKLEIIIGKDFIPVNFSLKNAENGQDSQLVIASKKDNNSNIDIYIFEITNNDILKKRFEFATDVFYGESLLLQAQNLFFKDDYALTIEGKTKDGKYKLFVISYSDEEFKKLDEFSADYSLVINYEEFEDEKSKYSRLKNIEIVNSASSTINSSLQKKEVFIWDYKKSAFQLSKTEQISSSAISSIDQSILYSEDKYYEFIKGFWYPERYKEIIESNKLNPDDFSDNEIMLIFISTNPNEVNIKYGNYVDKYSVVKITKSWNQKPGLRLVLKESYNPKTDYTKSMEITLMERSLVTVVGPEKFDNENFVRLPRPFLEYVREKREEIDKKNIDGLVKYLTGEFANKEKIKIIFYQNKNFQILKDKLIEKGAYKISYDKNEFIVSFLYEGQNSIFKNSNFIIKKNQNLNSFSLTPIKFDYNGYTIEDLNSIVFTKK